MYNLYNEGGVWLDIKSGTTCSLDSVLGENDGFLLSQWKNKMGEPYQGWGLFEEVKDIPGGEFQQWHIITAPKNPMLKQVILSVMSNIANYKAETHGVGHKGVMCTTGPLVYTRAIFPLLKSFRCRFVDAKRDLGLEYSVYKDQLAYRALYKQHYSQLNELVIRGTHV